MQYFNIIIRLSHRKHDIHNKLKYFCTLGNWAANGEDKHKPAVSQETDLLDSNGNSPFKTARRISSQP
jgi:hypothetical protein